MPSEDVQFSDHITSLVEGFLDQTLTPSEMAELETRLDESEQLRKHLAEMMSIDALLFGELAELPPSHSVPAEEEKIIGFPPVSERAPYGKMRKVNPTIAIAAGLAAAIAVWIGIMATFPGTPASADISEFAFVDRLDGAEWLRALDSDRFIYDTELKRGEEIDLKSGKIGVTFGNGSRLLIEGPASVVLESRDLIVLLNGKVVVTIPPNVEGFEVQSPGYLIEAAPPGSQSNGNLYAIGFDALANEIWTEAYEGEMEVSRLKNGYANKVANLRSVITTLEKVASVEKAKKFAVVLPQTKGGDVIQLAIPEVGELDTSTLLNFFGEGPLTLQATQDAVNSLSGPNLEPKGDSEYGSLWHLNIASSELPSALGVEPGAKGEVGRIFAYRADSSLRRSDFLGVWYVAQVGDQTGNTALRLRTDGAVVAESGSLSDLNMNGDALGWIFRNGRIRIVSEKGILGE